MSETPKTHFADDETLAHIAKLERELAAERKRREEAERVREAGKDAALRGKK